MPKNPAKRTCACAVSRNNVCSGGHPASGNQVPGRVVINWNEEVVSGVSGQWTKTGAGPKNHAFPIENAPDSDRSRASMRVGLADMVLGVKFEAEAGDEFKLGFEEIDMFFLVAHQLFEQVPGHVILGAVAIGRRLLVQRTG